MSPNATRVHQRFDSDQPHQLAAIRAVCDVLEGQPRIGEGLVSPQRLSLPAELVLSNLRAVQRREGLEESESLGLGALQLSVEMETGTGKTYAYLRLIRELHIRYGLSRFVAVVPSVAIREGLAAQIRATGPHLDALYPRARVTSQIYQGGRLSDLRRFAEGPGVQLLILNLDAFNKGGGNLIHRPADALGGRRPVELIASWRPVVLLDEPQNMEGPRAREALASLEALITVRWSATHRAAHHPVYRLDPVRAWDLGLVKRIEVSSVLAEVGAGPPPIELSAVRATRRTVSARLVLQAAGPTGPVRRVVTVRGEGEDLQRLAGGREVYEGWQVERVDADPPRVVFTNGSEIRPGAPLGGQLRAATMQAQIAETVEAHLEHELRVQRLCGPGQRLKVLSLVFVDRVKDWIDGGPVREWFDAAWETARSRPELAALALPTADEAAAAYFAERRGHAVDTTGRSRDDDAAYGLIMRDKERLLSRDEPVRFVVSHSALREGWDNPNVFQICTLHPSRSELRKRQEIGRGLRLPVREDGLRCTDPDIARLVVVANEHYDSFARALQAEVRADFGVELGARVADRRSRRRMAVREGWDRDPGLRAMWDRVGRAVDWCADIPEDAMRSRVRAALASLPSLAILGRASVTVTRAALGADGAMAAGTTRQQLAAVSDVAPAGVPDPVAALQRDTGLTARTLATALASSDRLSELAAAPIPFLDAAGAAIRAVVRALQVEHVRYRTVSEGPAHPIETFGQRTPRAVGEVVDLTKGPYLAVVASSRAEAQWLRAMDADPAIALVLRWPSWQRPASPLGALDPGWVLLHSDGAISLGPSQGQVPGVDERLCLSALAAALGVQVRPAG